MGDVVHLLWEELEYGGLVVDITEAGVYVEVDGPRPRIVVLPPSLVEPRISLRLERLGTTSKILRLRTK